MSVGGCEDVSSIMLLEYDFMSHTVSRLQVYSPKG